MSVIPGDILHPRSAGKVLASVVHTAADQDAFAGRVIREDEEVREPWKHKMELEDLTVI